MRPRRAHTPSKTYRFALYGRAASGKTCILAALAMDRVTHPQGYTCDWIEEPAGVQRPKGDPSSWDPRDPATAYHLGREWLRQARAHLERGDVPPPNPNQLEPFRFLFELTTPEQGAIQVELIDYSGELIDPAISDDELAQRLAGHLREMDGILILAEAPHPGHDHDPLFEEIRRLRQAFLALQENQLKGTHYHAPVALLVNKWDRRSSVTNGDRERLNNELQQFLHENPEPPHRALVNVLRNAVTENNFQAFAASAFGSHEVVTQPGPNGTQRRIERPKQVRPLPAYNLEDGLVQVARRRNAIDLEELDKRYCATSGWRFWQLLGGKCSPRKLRKRSRELLPRFPDDSPEHRRLEKIGNRSLVLFFVHLALWVGLGLLGTLIGEGVYDSQRIRMVEDTLDNPKAQPEQLAEASAWLEGYYTSPGYRHLLSQIFFTRETAKDKLNESRARREKLTWEVLAQAEEANKPIFAQQYLDLFPNGPHAAEARRIVEVAKLDAQSRKVREALSALKAEVAAALASPASDENRLRRLQARLSELHAKAREEDLFEEISTVGGRISDRLVQLVQDKAQEKQRQNGQYLQTMTKVLAETQREELLQKLLADLTEKGMPFPDSATPDQKRELAQLQQQARVKRAQEQQRLAWNDFKRKYQGLMDELQIAKAAHLLMEQKPETEELAQLKSDFRRRARAALEAKRDGYTRAKNWREATRWLTNVNADEVLLDLWPQGGTVLERMLAEVNREYDRALYERVRSFKDRESVEHYLEHAPLKTMKKHVEEYERFLTKSTKELDLTIVLDYVDWGEVKKRDRYRFTVEANGKELIRNPKVLAVPNTRSGEVGRGKITAKLADAINLKLSLILPSKTFFDSDVNYGKGLYNRTVAGLDGKRVEMVGENSVTSYAHFRVEGIPTQPELPAKWGE